MIKVVNNFLNNNHLLEIFQILQSDIFPWYYKKTERNLEHVIVKNKKEQSTFLYIADYFQGATNFKKIINFHIQYFPMIENIIFTQPHIDTEIDCTTLILNLNKNNGFTEIIGGPKVSSEENRAIIFPSKFLHKHSSTTNPTGRYVINISFI